MNERGAYLPPDNPFATRYVQPGALGWDFPPGETNARLVDRLRNANWWGEIVGPHGSGKSTLLVSLCGALSAEGREPIFVRLAPGEHRLPRDVWSQSSQWNKSTQVIVDGYEQLSRCRRALLIRRCRRQGCGLLVTTHEPTGLSVLERMQPSWNVFERLVAQLLTQHPGGVSLEEIRAAFERHGGNVREALFELYDRYEARRRTPAGP